MPQAHTIEDRIRRLEDRAGIGELIARYGLVMDNRDVAAMPALFTPDVVISTGTGNSSAVGRDAAVKFYLQRFAVLGPSNHVTHDRIVTFDADDPDRAAGLVLSHAEMTVSGQACVAAIRYVDRYQRHEGCWRFAARELNFMYYSAARAYADAFEAAVGGTLPADKRAVARDWSAQLELWRTKYGDWPGSA